MTAQQQEQLPGPAGASCPQCLDTYQDLEAHLASGSCRALKPPVIEAGRYGVFEQPDGDWVLARAVNLCDRCSSCGCGQQADPVPLPNFTRGKQYLVGWAMKNLANLRALMGGADGG